jgi:hypothetical protein
MIEVLGAIVYMILDNLQILVKAVPIKQGHTMGILWPITPNIRHYKEGPCKYVSHLIGHEGEGSLFYILKKLGKLGIGVLCCKLVTFIIIHPTPLRAPVQTGIFNFLTPFHSWVSQCHNFFPIVHDIPS